MHDRSNAAAVLFQETGSSLFRLIFDSLSAHVAILDKNGWILETNASWKKFATTNDLRMRPEQSGINYLDVCSSSLDASSEADLVYQGIRDLIEKRNNEFVMAYPCHSPDEKRWFYMRATRLETGNDLFIVVSHENITPLKQVQEDLLAKEQMLTEEQEKLKTQSVQLIEANTALKVLLNQREQDKTDLEEQFLKQIGELVLPHLDELMDSGLDDRQQALAGSIRASLDNISSPFLKRISSAALRLTPLEIRVADLVREGRTTKEIAFILSSSTDAIDFHRKNIRKKLGLTGQKINLRTHLLSLK